MLQTHSLAALGNRKHSFCLRKQQHCEVCFLIFSEKQDNGYQLLQKGEIDMVEEKNPNSSLCHATIQQRQKGRLMNVYITSILRLG